MLVSTTSGCGKTAGFNSAVQIQSVQTPNTIDKSGAPNEKNVHVVNSNSDSQAQTLPNSHERETSTSLENDAPTNRVLLPRVVVNQITNQEPISTPIFQLTSSETIAKSNAEDVSHCQAPDVTKINTLSFNEIPISDSQQAYVTDLFTYNDVVLAAISEKVTSSKAGIYRSVDGTTFAKVHDYLPVNHFAGGNGHVFMATDQGLFRSSDNGLRFSQLNTTAFRKVLFDGERLLAHTLLEPHLYASSDLGKTFSTIRVPVFDTKSSQSPTVSYFHGSQRFGFSFLDGSRFIQVDSKLSQFVPQSTSAQKLYQNCNGETFMVSGENNSSNQLKVHIKSAASSVVDSQSVSNFFAIESIRGFGSTIGVIATSSASSPRGDTFAVSSDLGKTWKTISIKKANPKQMFDSFYFYKGKVYIRSNIRDVSQVWGRASYFVSE